MKEFSRTALTEATMIVVAAIILSFTFTGIMGKGLFRVSPAPKAPTAADAVESTFLTYEEARGFYLRGSALFIDARHASDFNAGHIKGAVSIPLQEIRKNSPILSDLPRDRLLVAYCDGEGCSSSIELAKLLYRSGFSNVKVFFGGWNEWLAHKQPTDP